MPLWGASDAVEDKPKHFTDAEKLNVYATEQGWVKKTTGTGGRAGRVQEEIIVAIGDLSTSLNLADITAIDFNSTTADKSDGFTLSAQGVELDKQKLENVALQNALTGAVQQCDDFLSKIGNEVSDEG